MLLETWAQVSVPQTVSPRFLFSLLLFCCLHSHSELADEAKGKYLQVISSHQHGVWGDSESPLVTGLVYVSAAKRAETD